VSLNQRFVLRVQLNGEWEECSYSSPDEALAAFAGLAKDYKKAVQRAVLLPLTLKRSPLKWQSPTTAILELKSRFVSRELKPKCR